MGNDFTEPGCFDACTCDDVPDKTYDFLIKKEEQKDGLEVYKPKTTITYITQIKCPLCKCSIPEKEKTLIQNMFDNGNENDLLISINNYNEEVDNVKKIDNIKDLEDIYNEIQKKAQIIESQRFYKHTCTRNDICQRTSNQDIYIDLCSDSSKNIIENKIKVDLNKLKSDPIYKNNYLKDKRIAYEKNLLEEKKEKIERKYLYEFEEITFKKELKQYEIAKNYVIKEYDDFLKYKAINANNPFFRAIFNYTNKWYEVKNSVKYSGTKKKLMRFIENYVGKNIYDSVTMQSGEYLEFQKFIMEREPEYAKILEGIK